MSALAKNHITPHKTKSSHHKSIVQFVEDRFIVDVLSDNEVNANDKDLILFNQALANQCQCIEFYEKDNRSLVNVCNFNKIKFFNAYNIDLQTLTTELKSICESYYSNSIDRWQFGKLKSDLISPLNDIVNKRHFGAVFVDFDDHMHGGGVHLYLDITDCPSTQIFNALNEILLLTKLESRAIICATSAS